MNSSLFKIKEKLFKYLFLFQDGISKYIRIFSPFIKVVFSVLALFYIVLVILNIGFAKGEEIIPGIETFRAIFYGLFITRYLPELFHLKKRKIIRWIIDGGLFIGGLFLFVALRKIHDNELNWLNEQSLHFIILNVYLVLLIGSEIYRLLRIINKVQISPSLLFSLSFLFVILVGSGFLMLPNAQVIPLSYLDALFTSTSAVCVTGLIVVDTSTAFTELGKLIILILIQAGGLGIMTFTFFFSYVFAGSASLKDRMLLKEALSSERISDLFSILIQIISVTFFIEFIGAIFIFLSIEGSVDNPMFFSVFHSVSAFCNAGFSTLGGGLFNSDLQNNYPLQTVIALLIIVGGIGFPVLIAILGFIKNKIVHSIDSYKAKRVKWHMVTNQIGVKIVLVSTSILLLAGTVGYYFLEMDTSLKGTSGIQKFMTSFFGSVSARTAGFNVVDITEWSMPTILLMLILMWVGASPGSTGGGIKTTTFAVAMKTTYDFFRGKQNVEIGNREIGSETLKRVLVVIILSGIVISAGFFSLMINDPGKDPVYLLFESFSAFGTVGLSLVDTGMLSEKSKITIIIIMFLGRLGPLTVLSGLFFSNSNKYYKYPEHNFSIN